MEIFMPFTPYIWNLLRHLIEKRDKKSKPERIIIFVHH
jgi:hypothetical protein